MKHTPVIVTKVSRLATQTKQLLGLKHKRFTGSVLANQHTSFGALFLILLLVAPQLTIYRGLRGAVSSSGSVQVSATVNGPAPTTPAIITSPLSGTVYTPTITVSGTCGANLLVRIFRNDIFAGSTFCAGTGTFSLPISLYTGRNDLRALNYDGLDQAGPASPTVTISYAPLGTTALRVPTQTNILLEVDYHLRQVDPNQRSQWQLRISQGTAPYTLRIDWGDTHTDVRSVNDNNSFMVNHTYESAGIYTIIFHVQDSSGVQTQLQVAIVVNGQVSSPIQTNQTTGSASSPSCDNSAGFRTASCIFGRSLSSYLVPFFWLLFAVVAMAWGMTEYRRWKSRQTNKTAANW